MSKPHIIQNRVSILRASIQANAEHIEAILSCPVRTRKALLLIDLLTHQNEKMHEEIASLIGEAHDWDAIIS